MAAAECTHISLPKHPSLIGMFARAKSEDEDALSMVLSALFRDEEERAVER